MACIQINNRYSWSALCASHGEPYGTFCGSDHERQYAADRILLVPRKTINSSEAGPMPLVHDARIFGGNMVAQNVSTGSTVLEVD